MSYEHLFREAGAHCDEAGKFIDHALDCDFCRPILEMIGEHELEEETLMHILGQVGGTLYKMQAEAEIVSTLLGAIEPK